MPRSIIPAVALCCLLLVSAEGRAACDLTEVTYGTAVAELDTSAGTICIELFGNEAPLHVANFLYYENAGLITDTFFHRLVPGFVLQGGGFTVGALDYEVVPAAAPVTNEPCTLDTPAPPPAEPGEMICSFRGNERGTVALAKLGGDPNSGTTNFFVNLDDNRTNLDNQNGGFTVFGRVLQSTMPVVDAIEAMALPADDDVEWLQSAVFPPPWDVPLHQAPSYATSYGCFDPADQATVLNQAALPGLQALADPVIPSFPFTVSAGCGTPTTLATFVADPGPPECPDVDEIAVRTTGPATLQLPGGTPEYVELSCEETQEALDQRTLWRADFIDDFNAELVTVVPEPAEWLMLAAGLPLVYALGRSRRARSPSLANR